MNSHSQTCSSYKPVDEVQLGNLHLLADAPYTKVDRLFIYIIVNI